MREKDALRADHELRLRLLANLILGEHYQASMGLLEEQVRNEVEKWRALKDARERQVNELIKENEDLRRSLRVEEEALRNK
jgi:hypothetical protein